MIILHVARADLIDVHVVAHHFHLRRVHHFADGEQAEFVGGFTHQFQAGLAHALKRIGRGAWLECAGTQNFCAGFGDRFGDGLNLFARFDGTRTGGDDHIGAADFYAAAKIDDGAFRFELSAGQFERLGDAHDFAHALQQLKVAMIEIAVYADCAEYGVRCAGGAMHIEAVRHQFVDDVLNLGVRCALLHDDDHGAVSFVLSLCAQKFLQTLRQEQRLNHVCV